MSKNLRSWHAFMLLMKALARGDTAVYRVLLSVALVGIGRERLPDKYRVSSVHLANIVLFRKSISQAQSAFFWVTLEGRSSPLVLKWHAWSRMYFFSLLPKKSNCPPMQFMYRIKKIFPWPCFPGRNFIVERGSWFVRLHRFTNFIPSLAIKSLIRSRLYIA